MPYTDIHFLEKMISMIWASCGGGVVLAWQLHADPPIPNFRNPFSWDSDVCGLMNR